MPNLRSLICILNIPYARRPKAIDSFYGPDGVELCLDILGPCPLPTAPTPTVMRIDGCPGWRPGSRNAGIGQSSNPILAQAGYLTVSVSVRHTRQAHYPAQLDDTHTAIDWLHANKPPQSAHRHNSNRYLGTISRWPPRRTRGADGSKRPSRRHAVRAKRFPEPGVATEPGYHCKGVVRGRTGNLPRADATREPRHPRHR